MTQVSATMVRLRTPDGSIFEAQKTQTRPFWNIKYPEGQCTFQGSRAQVVRELQTLAQLSPGAIAEASHLVPRRART